jgi:hypothetical protein
MYIKTSSSIGYTEIAFLMSIFFLDADTIEFVSPRVRPVLNFDPRGSTI